MLQQRPNAVIDSAFSLVKNIDDQLANFAKEMDVEEDEPISPLAPKLQKPLIPAERLQSRSQLDSLTVEEESKVGTTTVVIPPKT